MASWHWQSSELFKLTSIWLENSFFALFASHLIRLVRKITVPLDLVLFILRSQSNFAPFTKWKINYTATKTLASTIRSRNTEIQETKQERETNCSARKCENMRKSVVTTGCTHAHHSRWENVTRAICNSSLAQANKTTTRLCMRACEFKVNYLYIVSMKQLIKLKMVLFNQTTSVSAKQPGCQSDGDRRLCRCIVFICGDALCSIN